MNTDLVWKALIDGMPLSMIILIKRKVKKSIKFTAKTGLMRFSVLPAPAGWHPEGPAGVYRTGNSHAGNPAHREAKRHRQCSSTSRIPARTRTGARGRSAVCASAAFGNRSQDVRSQGHFRFCVHRRMKWVHYLLLLPCQWAP